MASLPDKTTHSVQAGCSQGTKQTSSQVWETKTSSCQTVMDACVSTDPWDKEVEEDAKGVMVQVRTKTPTNNTVENVILKDFLDSI